MDWVVAITELWRRQNCGNGLTRMRSEKETDGLLRPLDDGLTPEG
jgi:hypothetical protein